MKPHTIGCQPEGRVPLLVLDINVCLTAKDQVHKLEMALVCGDGEGGVLGAGDRGRVDIRSSADQHFPHFMIPTRSCFHEWCETSLEEREKKWWCQILRRKVVDFEQKVIDFEERSGRF